MNSKRHHNQEIIIAALNIRKFFHLVAHEQIAAGKFITCEHRRRANAQTVKLRKYFVCAVAMPYSAIGRVSCCNRRQTDCSTDKSP